MQQYSYQNGVFTQYHGIQHNKKYLDIEFKLRNNPNINQFNCDIKTINDTILVHQQLDQQVRQIAISANNSHLIAAKTILNTYTNIQTFNNTFIQSQYSPFKMTQFDQNMEPKQSASKDSLIYIDDKLGPLLIEHPQCTLVLNIMASYIANKFQYYRLQIYTDNGFDKNVLEGLNYQAYFRAELMERNAIEIDGLVYLVYIVKVMDSKEKYNYQMKMNIFKVKNYDVLPVFMRDRVISNMSMVDYNNTYPLKLFNHENTHLVIQHCPSNMSYIKHIDKSEWSVMSTSQSTPELVHLQTDQQIECVDKSNIQLIQNCDRQSSNETEQQNNVSCHYVQMCLNRWNSRVDYLIMNVQRIEDEKEREESGGWAMIAIILGIVALLMVVSCIRLGIWRRRRKKEEEEEQYIDMTRNREKLI